MLKYRKAGPRAKASEQETPGGTGPADQAVRMKLTGLSYAEQVQTVQPKSPARAMRSADEHEKVRLSADPAPVLAPERESSNSPSDIAESGFADGGREVPHRQQMESSFGRSFGNVRAHTNGPARQANVKLGADAYAMDNRVAFKREDPSPALVAHELTHVVQETEGPAKSGNDGIDTSGEREAEAVEAAVASGHPATTVLGEGQGGSAGRQGVSRGKSGGPARKKGDYGLPVTFGADGLEVAGEYTLWDTKFPFLIVPGVWFNIEPSAKISVKTKADGDSSTSQIGLSGGIAAGFSVGAGAELFATLGGVINGDVTYNANDNGNTILTAGGDTKVEGKIGVRVPGVEFAYKLFEAELIKFTGIEYKNGNYTGSLKLEPGKDLVALIELLKNSLNKIGALIKKGVKITADVIHGMVDSSEVLGNLLAGFGRAMGEQIMTKAMEYQARIDPKNWNMQSQRAFVTGLEIWEAVAGAGDVLDIIGAARYRTLTSLGVSKDSIQRLAGAFRDYTSAREPLTAEDLGDMTPIDVADSLFTEGLLVYLQDPKLAYERFMNGTD